MDKQSEILSRILLALAFVEQWGNHGRGERDKNIKSIPGRALKELKI
jgi:hypothetical protein